MASNKVVVFLISFMLIVGCLVAGKRVQRDPKIIASLSNPGSQNYVPYPFPKKRHEIIADLVHFMGRYGGVVIDHHDLLILEEELESSLIHKDGRFHVGRILRVPNRIAMLHAPYVFVIQINHPDGRAAAFYGIEDTGLFAGSSTAKDKSSAFAPMRNAAEVRRDFKKKFPRRVGNGGGILKVSPVHLENSLYVCYFHLPPAWEIALKGGQQFICFESIGLKRKSRFFRIARSIRCKYGKWGYRDEATEREIQRERDLGNKVTVGDSINDRVFILEEIK